MDFNETVLRITLKAIEAGMIPNVSKDKHFDSFEDYAKAQAEAIRVFRDALTEELK